MPYKLIHPNLSHDTVQACTELLEGAQSGKIIGLGVVVVMRRRRFLVEVIGEAQRDPIFTRGALHSLDDCLREHIREAAH